jgi:perosamine synthetase
MSFIPFHRADISEREIRAVEQVLRSGWLTSGPVVKNFEQAFADAVNSRHAIAVNSCTAALHLALDAVGIGPGDEVVVPAMTFAATAEVVIHRGANPVIADIDPSDHNLSMDTLKQVASPRTKAVIPVDFGGNPADLPLLVEWAHRRGISVIEDAAHAFPAAVEERPVGAIADITCFSFYATKTVTCGEGGMATTQREEWAERMRLKSHHGISYSTYERCKEEKEWFYDIIIPGWKYNMTDAAAAIGLVQLERAWEMWRRRVEIAERYLTHFEGHEGLQLLKIHPERSCAWHLFVIKLVNEWLNIDRDRFIVELRKRGIGASVHFIPLHLHSYFRNTYHLKAGAFPNALDVFQRSISLPIYTQMSESQVERVIEVVLEILNKYHR